MHRASGDVAHVGLTGPEAGPQEPCTPGRSPCSSRANFQQLWLPRRAHRRATPTPHKACAAGRALSSSASARPPGTSGTVRRGALRHPDGTHSPVAVKLLNAANGEKGGGAEDNRHLRTLAQEVAILGSITHPHIVQVYIHMCICIPVYIYMCICRYPGLHHAPAHRTGVRRQQPAAASLLAQACGNPSWLGPVDSVEGRGELNTAAVA